MVQRLSVFGLGYVGSVSAACLAQDGHQVIGVDIQAEKVAQINAGHAPVAEKGLDALIAGGLAQGRLSAVVDAASAIHQSDLSFICVGTPSKADGSLDLQYLQATCQLIGAALKDKTENKIGDHHVVVRSTVLPGTIRQHVRPWLEAAAGKAVTVSHNPEFLREGTALADYRNPAKTLIGCDDEAAYQAVHSLYASLPGKHLRTSIELAELAKYTDNVWHALKVAFANEMGSLAKAQGLDGQALMDLFVQDDKLNISSTYLQPGFAFGGSCLPKDLRALAHLAASHSLDLPLLKHVLPSNQAHLARAVDAVLAYGKRRIGILGLSFKPGTDDVRESPTIALLQALLAADCAVKLYDPNIALTALMGQNKAYMLEQLPTIADLLVDAPQALLDHAEVLVLTNADPAYAALCSQADARTIILNLTHQPKPDPDITSAAYHGLCW